MHMLMTIGYEGLTSQRFFDILLAHDVQTLIDVRELPLSRKPGFSKSALGTAACERDIQYTHLPSFGCPRPIRYDYRADGDWVRYTERFLAYLETQELPLAALQRRVLASRCCLLCFEADYNRCHRSFVAERVAAESGIGLAVAHLTATDPSPIAQAARLELSAGISAR